MNPIKENTKTPPNVAKIKISKNGPDLIYGKLPIQKMMIIADSDGTATEWQLGTKYPLRKIYSICRCGQSKNKPFCDGTHVKSNFGGAETAGEEDYFDMPKEIDGATLKLTDIEELCASARFCHRAGGIWNLVPESGKPEKKRIAVEEACDCPSGRLVILDKQAGKTIEPNLSKSIGLIEDPMMGVSGPIWVRGGIPVESADGETYHVRNRLTLCRCGKSKNKPFCDSSHYPEAEDVEKVHNE
ncbi:MAG: CDGSH iron-sulfur domain-containing protein [Candidatus Bathyarchaeia archaeon]|nr:CDGSH iron-sulfur domain-containing protein [Candidatus Bathyarchaeia archaeon]